MNCDIELHGVNHFGQSLLKYILSSNKTTVYLLFQNTDIILFFSGCTEFVKSHENKENQSFKEEQQCPHFIQNTDNPITVF